MVNLRIRQQRKVLSRNVEYPVFLFDSYQIWILSTKFHKVRLNFTSQEAMTAHRRSSGIAPLFLQPRR